MQPVRLSRLSLPLSLILLPLLLSSCGVGDIGSSSSTASASVDNSSNDNSVHGETQCDTSYDLNPDGTCKFTQACNGVEVQSGDFQITATSPCPTPSPAPAADSPAVVTDTTTTTPAIDQGSAL